MTSAEDWPTWPRWDDAEASALREVLESGRWQAGPQVHAFEQEFASYQGSRHAIAVTNGTSSMEIALRAAGVQPGDEVIIPSYTFIATALAPMALGAIPVLVDSDPESSNIDPQAVLAAVTERTRAIIPVHVGGRPADLDELIRVGAANDLLILDDAAHAHGAEWRSRRIGSVSDVASFSFQTGKNVTSGDGGCLVTSDDDLADRIRSVRDFGRDATGRTVRVGGNYRMTDFQAAVLRCQLRRLDEQIAARARNVSHLRSALEGVAGIRLAATDPRVTREPYYQVLFHLDEEAFGLPKPKLLQALAAEGVPLDSGYEPLHRMPFFHEAAGQGAVRIEECGRSERLADHTVLWLSFRMALAPLEQIGKIVEALLKVQSNAAALR